MLLSPLLKLREKVMRKGKSLTQDEEKPFLEHLDDLRTTITRILLTLMIAVVVCFIFAKDFFTIIKKPLIYAHLNESKERNLPKAIVDLTDLTDYQKQQMWWRIHGTARGMADLDGEQRALFLKFAAGDDVTRRFALALLYYHAADCLPEKEREGYIAAAAKLLPEGDQAKVVEYAAQLVKAETSPALEKPHNFVEMEAFAPAEGFMLSMKLSLYAGIIVSFPLLFYFLLEFILPGLTGKERRMIFPALSIGFGLFLIGVLFAYYVVVPQALDYFHEYSNDLGIVDNWRIGLYISFVTSFILIFGLVFETPVVIMIMVKLGLLTSTTMRKTRGWAVIIMLVAAAVITPTGDMLSMSLMAGPMIVMYEACIWLAVLHERKVRRREAEEQREDQVRRAALFGVASVQTPRPGSDPDAPSGDSDGGQPSPTQPLLGGGDGGHDSGHLEDSGESTSGSAHPHHPEQSSDESIGDYEQYLRDHNRTHSLAETHAESIPVEDRPDHDPVPESPVTPGHEEAAPDARLPAVPPHGDDTHPATPAQEDHREPSSPDAPAANPGEGSPSSPVPPPPETHAQAEPLAEDKKDPESSSPM